MIPDLSRNNDMTRLQIRRKSLNLLNKRILVRVGKIVFSNISDVDHRLHGKQAEMLDGVLLEVIQCNRACRFPVQKGLLNSLQSRFFSFLLDFGLGILRLAFVKSVEPFANLIQVAEDKLEIDDINVRGGINFAIDMNNVVVLKTADHLEDRIHFTDVR